MSNFQKRILVFKVVIGLGALVSLNGISLSAFADSGTLLTADSLFQSGKYTESFVLYDQMVEQGKYTPSMLLKMSFIREGLGDVSGAMYYLNLYYNQTSNKKVLIKLQEMAEENQLIGYDFGDSDFFINLYHQYSFQILLLLLAISLLLMTTGIDSYRKSQQYPVARMIIASVVVGILLYLNNYGVSFKKGIIVDPQTYLMTGPSGASDVLDIIDKGHRVDILGRQGVWVKIRWANREVYVRENKIKQLS